MQERRTAPRYRLSLTLKVMCVPVAKESELLHATELTHESDVVIDAQARVVRVVEKPENVVKRVGIAALIERYNIIHAKPATT